MLTTAFLIMQFIISAKAGLVNDVEGDANVRVNQQVNAGVPIQTGATGRVEVMLNPGSFLRLGENSEVVLDSVDLTDIQVRVVSGIAIIESSAVDKNSPIRVSSGDKTQLIASPGVYKFTENGLPEQTSELEQWSQQRSKEIAAINARSAQSDSASYYPTDPYGQLLYPGGPFRSLPGSSPYLAPYPRRISRHTHSFSRSHSFHGTAADTASINRSCQLLRLCFLLRSPGRLFGDLPPCRQARPR